MAGLTLQFIPYSEIESLSSLGRIKRLLHVVKEGKIVVLEGRLTREEEAELIAATMEEIDSKFKGIELHVVYPGSGNDPIKKLKSNIANVLLGNRQGLTIIGPASIVKEIRKDPRKIELLTRSPTRRSSGKKKRRR